MYGTHVWHPDQSAGGREASTVVPLLPHQAANPIVQATHQGLGALTVVQLAMAVWTQRHGVLDSIRSAIGQVADVVNFKEGRPVRAVEGRWLITALAVASCLLHHPGFDRWVALMLGDLCGRG